MYIWPQLSSTNLHIIADATLGIGVQGILLVYLCLFEGLKYHTAVRSKRRAESQRKALQLRRAIKHVECGTKEQNMSSPTAVEDYYKEFGDTDGSAFTYHLRLPNDPFADGWADFLLPKIFLWIVGGLSVTVAAYCRFFPDGFLGAGCDYATIELVYFVSGMVHVLTILVWVYLIVHATGVTGEALRQEPFLGTRPAQLAFRVLFAHAALVVTALAVSFILYIGHLRRDWHGNDVEMTVDQGEKSDAGLLKNAIYGVITQFPYSGTASTVGFGRLLCVTVEVLITAFIFLPAHTMDSVEEDDGDEHTGIELRNIHKNKRDKRLVVHLAKESKTWRIFPCPIQRFDNSSSPLRDNMYQIYKDLHTGRETQDRGLVSIGPYTPVFCAELAAWLNEASWQAYYSPPGAPQNMVEKDDFEGWMKLDIIGLQLEGYVYDERTNAQAYIATNVAPQVDGEEDSIIVVAFRGTSNVRHMQIDLRMRQVSAKK
jgi:hypothetical protein